MPKKSTTVIAAIVTVGAILTALILLGDVESAVGNAADSEKAYLSAFKAAAARDDRAAAAEALCNLIELSAKGAETDCSALLIHHF